jgi:hypothetical protein
MKPEARAMLEHAPPSEVAPKLPQWWNPQIEASWKRSRAAALGDWAQHGVRSPPTDTSIEEHALAFGHGARSAYSHCTSWEAASPRLREDWIDLGNVGPAAWDRVAHIVRHEWLRAAGPGGDASAWRAPC